MDKKGKLTMRDLWVTRDLLEDMQRNVDEDLQHPRPVLPVAWSERTQLLALNDRLRLEDRMVRWLDMGGV